MADEDPLVTQERRLGSEQWEAAIAHLCTKEAWHSLPSGYGTVAGSMLGCKLK